MPWNRPLPWKDNTFDQVMLCHVLEHVWLDEIPSFLHEVQRVTKSSGQVLVICPDINTMVRSFVTIGASGRLGFESSTDASRPGGQKWFADPPPDPGWGNPEWTTEVVLRTMFADLVLEDDQLLRMDATTFPFHCEDALPSSDHRWNSYGNRLLKIMSEIFPNSELLGTNGIPEEISEQGFDPFHLNRGDDFFSNHSNHFKWIWTDPRSDFVWPTCGWTPRTCSVLAQT